MPRSHRHPCLPLWAPLSTQPRPHRELHSVHSAAGREVAPPPPSTPLALGGRQFMDRLRRPPPSTGHWRPLKAHTPGCSDLCRGQYTMATDSIKSLFSCAVWTAPTLACIAVGVGKLEQSNTKSAPWSLQMFSLLPISINNRKEQ